MNTIKLVVQIRSGPWHAQAESSPQHIYNVQVCRLDQAAEEPSRSTPRDIPLSHLLDIGAIEFLRKPHVPLYTTATHLQAQNRVAKHAAPAVLLNICALDSHHVSTHDSLQGSNHCEYPLWAQSYATSSSNVRHVSHCTVRSANVPSHSCCADRAAVHLMQHASLTQIVLTGRTCTGLQAFSLWIFFAA
jgi:hypothetical protein